MPTNQRRLLLCSASLLVIACGEEDAPTNAAPLARADVPTQPAVVGQTVNFDVSVGFADRQPVAYRATITPANSGLVFLDRHVVGAPNRTGVVSVTVTAAELNGTSTRRGFSFVAFAPGLTTPTLPPAPFPYADARRPIPQHYLAANAPGGAAAALSNVPASNPTTDAGATLGRVLFYDKRLSVNDRVSCSSCHVQRFGFSDTSRFSTGVNGQTTRHSMALANARFYRSGRFFWDERAQSAEAQALQPIANAVEMGMLLSDVPLKLEAAGYYGPLFNAAFGTPEITTDRVARAIAQFVRSINSYGARFDSSFAPTPGQPPPPGPNLAKLTAQEVEGFNLFNGPAGCAPCHSTNAHASDNLHNTGLDATVTDPGAGNGRFKAPSLRNVAVRGRYMHDGRFTSLDQVVAFYDTAVKQNPFLDGRLRVPGGQAPRRLNLTQAQRDALVAFLKTLTDAPMLTDPRFSNPFPP